MVDEAKKSKSWLEKDAVNGSISDLFDNAMLKAAVTPADVALDFVRGVAGTTGGDSKVQDIGRGVAAVAKFVGCGDVESASPAEANLTSLFVPGLKGKPKPDEMDKPKTGKENKDPSSFTPGPSPAGGGGAPGAGGGAMAGAGPAGGGAPRPGRI